MSLTIPFFSGSVSSRCLLLLPLFASLFEPTTAQERAGDQQNAALKYWQAYASMSRSLDEETRRKVDSYFETEIDDTARRAVHDCVHAMYLLHKGARLPVCEWQVDLDHGPNSTIEHYEPVRALARLTCLSARTHFEKGIPSAGVEDAFAMIALGRHVATDDLFACRVSQASIESLAILTLARYLPRLSPEELRRLDRRLEIQPPIAPTRVESEQLAQSLTAVRVRRQLLIAAVAVRLDGEAALKQFKDPHGDGPFGYRKLNTGYELSSKFSPFESKIPIRLTVGQEAAR